LTLKKLIQKTTTGELIGEVSNKVYVAKYSFDAIPLGFHILLTV